MGRKLPRPSPNPCVPAPLPPFPSPLLYHDRTSPPAGLCTSSPSHWPRLATPLDPETPSLLLEKTEPPSPPPSGRPSPRPSPPFPRSRPRRSAPDYHHPTDRSPLRAWRVVGQVCQRSIHKPLSCPEGDRTQFLSLHKKDPYPPDPSRPLLSCRFPMAYRHRDLLHPRQPGSRLTPLHSPILPHPSPCFLLHPQVIL